MMTKSISYFHKFVKDKIKLILS